MYKKIQRLALARALNVPLEYLVDDALDDPPPASSPIASDERALLDLLRQMEVPARAVREALVRGGTAILSGAARESAAASQDPTTEAGPGLSTEAPPTAADPVSRTTRRRPGRTG